jgi:hypothetical protein
MLVQVLVLLLLTALPSEAKRKSDNAGPRFPVAATSAFVSSKRGLAHYWRFIDEVPSCRQANLESSLYLVPSRRCVHPGNTTLGNPWFGGDLLYFTNPTANAPNETNTEPKSLTSSRHCLKLAAFHTLPAKVSGNGTQNGWASFSLCEVCGGLLAFPRIHCHGRCVHRACQRFHTRFPDWSIWITEMGYGYGIPAI